MRKKVLIIVSAVATVLAVIGIALFLYFTSEPNMMLKKLARPLTENKIVEVDYDFKSQSLLPISEIPDFTFTPSDSAKYKFEVTDIVSDDDVILAMYVMDEGMSDYLAINNYSHNEDASGVDDVFTGETFLQKSHRCYVILNVFSEDPERTEFKGSFKLRVTRAAEEEKPAELVEGEPIRLNVKAETQKCALFRPSVTGYYWFDTEIVSKDASSGFASISSVTDDNGMSLRPMNGMCYMEAGHDYYVWVTVDETNKRYSRVSLSGQRLGSEQLNGLGAVEISGDTLLEFTIDNNEQIVIYSESGGDPEAYLYDSEGFPLRTDNDSGGTLSGNDKDFAMAFNAAAGKTYKIFISGEFSECKVIAARYTGDGTTLEPDDIDLGEESEEPAEEAPDEANEEENGAEEGEEQTEP